MPNLWEDAKKSLKEWGTIAADKAEELTKTGRIKLDMLSVKRDIEKNFVELGGKVYHLIHEEGDRKIAANAEVKKIVSRVATLETTLKEKEKELEQLGDEEEPDVEPVKKEETDD